ncbi:MAG: hypothetical protein IBJ17_07700 [Reyranella sp.]|nr:hypothetical protein [Reyranella sp.]
MHITARQAYDLRTIQPGAMLPAPWHAMSTADLKARAERDEAAERRAAAAAGRGGAAPGGAGTPPDPIDRALRRGPPSRPTTARLKTYFLRVFERCGSVAEAAARAGITPRTVQRWVATDPKFAARYAETKARRVELLEDLALQRASGRALEPRFYHGQQVATVERHNDRMLLRVLDRFDRAQEREVRAAAVAQAARDMEAEIEKRLARKSEERRQADERFRAYFEKQFEERVAREVEKRISEMSPSMRL